MQAITSNGGLVVFLLPDDAAVRLTDAGLIGSVRAPDIKPETYTVVKGVPTNPDYVPGYWLYDAEGGWRVADAERWAAHQADVAASAAADEAAALESLRVTKNAEINAARLAANFGTFTYSGKLFACDQLSRSDIDGTNGYVALNNELPAGWPGGWKAVDNTYIAITSVDEWKAFYGAMFAAGNANFAHSQTLKAQLASATTRQQIEAVKW